MDKDKEISNDYVKAVNYFVAEWGQFMDPETRDALIEDMEDNRRFVEAE